MNLPETSFIGVGGLGKAFVRALISKNVPVKSVFNRTEEKARQLASTVNIGTYDTFPSTQKDLGELTFITVSDDAIEDVAGRISKLHDDFSDCTFVHCSGTQTADLLQSLKSKGAKVASFHPLQTFTAQANPKAFKDIYFTLQGNAEAFPVLKKLAEQLGAESFEVTEEQKSHLHVAAVMASNYLSTLIDASVETGTLSGLSNKHVKKALLPLIKTTLNNNELYSSTEALTGPIKRGDIATLEKHLTLLEDEPELRDLYCLLGLKTVGLAVTSGNADKTTVEKMRDKLLE